MSSSSPIGVFDSGVGGLTVVKEIMRQLPGEQIIYFGDTARVPYGNKSKETVLAYSRQIVHFLMSKNVKVIVVACNTASAFALETLMQEVPVPMIGVVAPGAEAAAAATKNNRIGVIATRGTIGSGVYEALLKETNPKIQVFAKACPLFVPLVEEGLTNDPVTVEIAKRYTAGLLDKNIDTLVLGCTHYPLIRRLIQQVVGEGITLVNPAYETAKSLAILLKNHQLPAPAGGEPHTHAHTFYVSDSEEQFKSFANSILPCEMIETKDVHLKTFE